MESEWEFAPQDEDREWTDDRGYRWRLTFTFAGPVEPNGTIECIGFAIAPSAGYQELSASTLRGLRFWEEAAAAKEVVGAQLSKMSSMELASVQADDPHSQQLVADFRSQLQPYLAKLGVSPGPGRPPRLGPDHWGQVARVYRMNNTGKGSTPTRAVAEHFAVSRTTAGKWVARARALGLDLGRRLHEGRPKGSRQR